MRGAGLRKSMAATRRGTLPVYGGGVAVGFLGVGAALREIEVPMPMTGESPDLGIRDKTDFACREERVKE
jgi:hypothetical protein